MNLSDLLDNLYQTIQRNDQLWQEFQASERTLMEIKVEVARILPLGLYVFRDIRILIKEDDIVLCKPITHLTPQTITQFEPS